MPSNKPPSRPSNRPTNRPSNRKPNRPSNRPRNHPSNRPSNSNALVVHNPNQGRPRGGRSQDQRPSRHQHGPRWENDDDMSDVSDAYYDPEIDEPRFKYSTAELYNAPCLRNQNCCIATVIVVCFLFAIICTVVYLTVVKGLTGDDATKPPTPPPTVSPTLSFAPTIMNPM